MASMIGSLMADEPEADFRLGTEVLFWNLHEVTKDRTGNYHGVYGGDERFSRGGRKIISDET